MASVRVLLGVTLLGAVLGGCTVMYSPPVDAPPPPPAPAPPPPPPSIDASLFFDSLDPYGDWVWASPYGWVWAPGAVDPFWRPYTLGRWVWTDYGWTWVSDEAWGWACYHYGRWTRVPRHGWVWVPGTIWGPSWVVWRSGPGIVGWAPLPPEVGFRVGVGIDVGSVDIDVVIRPDWWCFVDEARIVEPSVVRYAYPVGRNVTVVRNTTRVVRIEISEGRIVNRGVDYRDVERTIGRPVPRYRLVDSDGPPGRATEVRPGQLKVWRPELREVPSRSVPHRAFPEPETRAAKPADRPVEPPPLPPREEKIFDKRWNKDWKQLQSVQKRDAPRPPAAPPAGQDAKVVERHQEENYEASQNALKEQQALRERTQRGAERPRPAPPGQARRAKAGEESKEKPKGQQEPK